MSWEQPSYVEITMNSEIGAYQDEFSGWERRHDEPAPDAHDAVAVTSCATMPSVPE